MDKTFKEWTKYVMRHETVKSHDFSRAERTRYLEKRKVLNACGFNFYISEPEHVAFGNLKQKKGLIETSSAS